MAKHEENKQQIQNVAILYGMEQKKLMQVDTTFQCIWHRFLSISYALKTEIKPSERRFA